MIDISNKHPYSACAEFAVRLITNLTEYDLAAIEASIDQNHTGLTLRECFPEPKDFQYGSLLKSDDWTLSFIRKGDYTFLFDVQIPLNHPDCTHTYVRFKLSGRGNQLVVDLWETLPHVGRTDLRIDDLSYTPSRIQPPTRDDS